MDLIFTQQLFTISKLQSAYDSDCTLYGNSRKKRGKVVAFCAASKTVVFGKTL